MFVTQPSQARMEMAEASVELAESVGSAVQHAAEIAKDAVGILQDKQHKSSTEIGKALAEQTRGFTQDQASKVKPLYPVLSETSLSGQQPQVIISESSSSESSSLDVFL